MRGLSVFWRWWTESWRSARQARLLYIVMGLGFGLLAVVALAGVAALFTLAMALLAPWLTRWMRTGREERR
ncbi:MAG: hypothetical protein IH866_02335 [Chloroflexi bacterium]|nr:hypothetical protein [Chloroflexota bacterium]